jgi:ribulose-5-phosphate 4-epimerase/fuculose-1-phosphate aldolase
MHGIYATRDQLIDDLVWANKILVCEEVLDAYGHVSARDDHDPSRFYLSSYLAPGMVTRDDILTFDLEGNALDANGRKLYSELWIHAAIYAARPDVYGVVHSHSHSVISFGSTRVPLRPIFHMGSFLGKGAAQFDTRDRFGDTDLFIRNMDIGRALAESLGDNTVALMRGHGSVAVGSSLRESVYRAVYTEVNAKLQSEAVRLGDPTFLSEGEVRLRRADGDASYKRPWDFWKERVGVRPV